MEVLTAIRQGSQRSDANASSEQFLYVSGVPGSGKSEVLIAAALEAAEAGLTVMILCPTGILVHAYRSRLEHENIIVETIHSSWQILRVADELVNYAPPSRLRRVDLFILDEASQVDDDVFRRVYLGFKELPQQLFLAVAADYQQLNPIGSGACVRRWVERMPTVVLGRSYRSVDNELNVFLASIRTVQPPKARVAAGPRQSSLDSETKGLLQLRCLNLQVGRHKVSASAGVTV